MYNTSEESQTEVISETVVRTGPDGKPVFPHNEGGPTEAEVRRDMKADKKPAPSTRAPKKPAPSTRAGKQMKEESSIDEGIMGALKKVGKAILGPADQSPEAEAARMGKRRGPGTPNKAPMKGDTVGTPMKTADTPNNARTPMKTADTPNNARTPMKKADTAGTMKEDADVFDIVKEYLMTEHDATEEEALKVMLELTAEERTAIVEGTPADRARRAVKHQRDGYHGDDDALTKEMDATKAAVARLRKA